MSGWKICIAIEDCIAVRVYNGKKKNCIAIGNGLYCREGGLMVELYCNTIGCIVNSNSNSNSQRSTVNINSQRSTMNSKF